MANINWAQILRDALAKFTKNIPDYHPEWDTGKWRSNCHSPEDFQVLYIEGGTVHRYGINFTIKDLDSNIEYLMGPPEGLETDACNTTMEQLLNLGTVGVYERSRNPLLVIANKVRQGILAADFWIIDLDLNRVDKNEFDIVCNNIADCIAIGVTKGICPFWELRR